MSPARVIRTGQLVASTRVDAYIAVAQLRSSRHNLLDFDTRDSPCWLSATLASRKRQPRAWNLQWRGPPYTSSTMSIVGQILPKPGAEGAYHASMNPGWEAQKRGNSEWRPRRLSSELPTRCDGAKLLICELLSFHATVDPSTRR
jgi:hypothetical protein